MVDSVQPAEPSEPFVARAWSRLRRHGFSLLLVAAGLTIAALIRASLFDFRSADLNDSVLPWCDAVKETGLAGAFRGGRIDYNPPYIYLLWIVTKLPIPNMAAVKLFSVAGDVACAITLASIVRNLGGSRMRAALAAFTLLLAPTVVFNSSLWGQCDILFVFPLMVALAAFLRGRMYLTTTFFALAIAVKLQAIFLFPLLGIWLIRKQLPWRALLPLPVTFFLTLVPAWIAGLPLRDLVMVYPRQAGKYTGLSMNSASIYNWLPDNEQWLPRFGLSFACGLVFALVVACIRTDKKVQRLTTVAECTMFACVMPFLLPHMHERYVFLGDVLCILYAFLAPRHAWLALAVVGSSLFSYFPFLFSRTPVPLGIAALMLFAACLFLVVHVLRTHYPTLFAPASFLGQSAEDAEDSAKPAT